jgi:hypothetical protein
MPSSYSLQPYPREGTTLLAAHSLFPKQNPPLNEEEILTAVTDAFSRVLKNKVGKQYPAISDTEGLVNLCIKHLKERNDPIFTPYFYSSCQVDEIFELDSISYEFQRQRMKIGVFYQFLIIELMRASSKKQNSNIESVFDGSREGDVVADMKTPNFDAGVRIYGSIKKSSDTVGGQDVEGVIKRLESVAKSEKNLTRPYLCVFCYATPPAGKIKSYELSRSVKYNKEGHPYSPNCESWQPGFLFPFITGHSPEVIYRISMQKIGEYLPFYAYKKRKECSVLLKEKFIKLGLVGTDGKLDKTRFVEFLTKKS